jgi:hypothetical protein
MIGVRIGQITVCEIEICKKEKGSVRVGKGTGKADRLWKKEGCLQRGKSVGMGWDEMTYDER